MKKLRGIPYLAIFLLNLLVGFLGGSKVLPERTGLAYPIIEKTGAMDNSIPALANEQRSILLVTVDDLDASKPRLTGVWAVLYVPTNPRLTLLPIYPTLNRGSEDKLANSFRLYKEAGTSRLDPAFVSLLEEHIPWWSGYILLDHTALTEVVNYWAYSPGLIRESSLFGSSSNVAKHYGSQVISDLPSVWEDPYSSLFSQASLYQELCWGATWTDTGFEAGQTLEHMAQIKNHYSTDLDPETILAEMQSLRGLGGSLVCEFPTISVQARIVK
jgi:hypothetical protein